MSKIGIIYNKNKLLEEKMNFFCDYFSFYTTYAGIFFETELENPLSLIEKIIFQIDNNNSKENACNYITNYLNHSYFLDNSFLDIFESYKPLKLPIREFKSIEEGSNNMRERNKAKAKWIKRNELFVINLRLLYKELSESMYQKAFVQVLQMVTCTHELKKHETGIKYLTKILVTEPLFKGRSKSEVENVFLRILSNDIKKFPFPKTVISENERMEYIERRDFAKQFEGLIHFLEEEPSDKFFLCKVYGISIEDSSSFRYNRTKFLSQHDSQIISLKENLIRTDKSLAEMFFAGSDFLFAKIPIRAFGDEIVTQNILPELQDSVEYLEIVLDKYLFIDHKSYVITRDFLTGTFKGNWGNGFLNISNKDKEKIDDNPYTFLNKLDSPAKNHLLKHERIFLHAMHYNNLAEYWRYFENILLMNSSKTVDTVAALLLLNEKEIRDNQLTNYLFQNTQPWHFDYHRLGITPVAFLELYNELQKFKSKNFFEVLDYPFFNEIKSMKQKRHTVNRYGTLKDFYARILWELYEVRNTITHQNLIQQRAKIKLQNSVHELTNRFRWVLFFYIRKYPNLNFKQIIDKAKKDSLKLGENIR